MDNTISQTSGAGAASSAATAKKPSQELGKDAFLKLLVAQLQNQDPTESQDPNQMVQQMTSFSTLEQMQNTNTLLQGIQMQNIGLFQAQASGLVGKSVKVASDQLQLDKGKATFDLNLPADAEKVTVSIKDANGKVVRTFKLGEIPQGAKTFTWDGLDDAGASLKDGSYTVTLDALDEAAKPVKATTTTYARVDAVIFGENGTIFLMAGKKKYSLSDVTEIGA